MAKLTNDQLEVLVAKRNKAGVKEIVQVMNMEELKAYKENCLEAIARLEGQIARTKKVGGVMQRCFAENKEVLEVYVAYIEAKEAEETEEAEEAEEAAEVKEVTGLEAIDAFIEGWKVRCCNYYMKLKNEYNAVRYGEYEINKENLEAITDAWGRRKHSDEKIQEILNRDLSKSDIEYIQSSIRHGKKKTFESMIPKSDVKILERMYGTKEQQYQVIMNIAEIDGAKRKEKLIARVEAKAGKIIEASGLSMGDNLEINGYITGETKRVHVQTIYAGGHNIQELHFRVLVK